MHPCDRCTATCHVRVSCDTTGRVSLLKEALLSRFYRRTETPVHRPRPIRERERERRETATSETDQTNDRTNQRSEPKLDLGRSASILARSSPRLFQRKDKRWSEEREERKFAHYERSKNLGSRCRHARCARVRVAWAERKGAAGSLSLPLFFLSFFPPWRKRLRLETEGGTERGRKKKCINFPAPIEATDAHRRRETTIHLPRVPLFVQTFDLS